MELINVYGFILPEEVMLLLIYLPILTTLVATSRYVLGLKAFGTYVPVILSFAYYFLDPTPDKITGLKYGLVITLVLVASALIVHKLIEKIRMNFFAKMAIMYTGASIALIITFAIMSKVLPGRFHRLIPLPILMIATLTDRLTRFQIKKTTKSIMILFGETLLLSVLGYFLLKWTALRELLLPHPEILLLVLVVDFIIGKYSGFRLTEFSRFSAILFDTPEELQEE
jgi:hypothetical protein